MDLRLRVLGGTALVAAAGSAAGILLLGGRDTAVGCTPLRHAAVPPAAETALTAYAGEIKHDVERAPDGTHEESWEDALAGRQRYVGYGPGGEIRYAEESTRQGRFEHFVTVQYDGRFWMDHKVAFPSQAAPRNEAAQIAQTNRDQVANGRTSIIGRDRVDGRTTLHLHQVVHPQFPGNPQVPKGVRVPAPPTFQIDTWVDPLTYLTVRTRFSQQGGSLLTDETWLPRTAANVAQTKLVIPPGFRHLVPRTPRGSSQLVLLKACQ